MAVETKLNIIDVNRFNPSVDWTKVKEQTDGVIIRVGYRGIKGNMSADPSFITHLKGAIDAGVERIGAYWWSSHQDPVDADVDASYVMSILQQYKEKINFGVWLQSQAFPSECAFNELSASRRTECAHAFLTEIQVQGLRAGVYAADDWFAEELVPSELTDYPLWVASYGDKPPQAVEQYAGWQYENAAKVDGVTRGVGRSWFYTDLAAGK